MMARYSESQQTDTGNENTLPSIIIGNDIDHTHMQPNVAVELPRLPSFVGALENLTEQQQRTLMKKGSVLVTDQIFVETRRMWKTEYKPRNTVWEIRYKGGQIIYSHDGWQIEVDGRRTSYFHEGKRYDRIRPSETGPREEVVLRRIKSLVRQGYKPDKKPHAVDEVVLIKDGQEIRINVSGAETAAHDYLHYFFSNDSRRDPNVQIPKYLIDKEQYEIRKKIGDAMGPQPDTGMESENDNVQTPTPSGIQTIGAVQEGRVGEQETETG